MEPPDFDQIALRLLGDLPDAFLTRGASASTAVPGVVAQLRQVWNARGAADRQAMDVEVLRVMRLIDVTHAEVEIDVERTLKALDEPASVRD